MPSTLLWTLIVLVTILKSNLFFVIYTCIYVYYRRLEVCSSLVHDAQYNTLYTTSERGSFPLKYSVINTPNSKIFFSKLFMSHKQTLNASHDRGTLLKWQYAGKHLFPPVVRTCSPEVKNVLTKISVKGGGRVISIFVFFPHAYCSLPKHSPNTSRRGSFPLNYSEVMNTLSMPVGGAALLWIIQKSWTLSQCQ